MTQGRCLCGALRYEIDGPFVDLVHCHCSMCRKHHGAPFSSWAVAPIAGFRWTSDTATLGSYQSSERGHREFCTVCGSVAPMLDEAHGIVIAPAGNLEGDLGLRPTKHMFVASKASWYAITDDLPQHDEFPAEFGRPSTPREPVPLKPGVAQGSCLCGAVAYEITTPPMFMYQCHCSRCRLGRSAAHGANVFYKADGFAWTRGAELVQDYAVPEAKFFAVAFCRRCGSAVPRVSAARNIVSVPAGSLDSEPGIEPTGHIYVGSKAPWFEITGDLPQFAEMPPRP